MKKPPLPSPIAFVTGALYLANRFWAKDALGSTFLSYYFNDLLFLPFLLSWSQWGMRLLPGLRSFTIRGEHALFCFLYASFMFEWLIPHWNTRYTNDMLDVGMYALGAVGYMIAQSLFRYSAHLSFRVPVVREEI